jgi:trehalose synthase
MASQRLNGSRPKRGPRSPTRGKDQARQPAWGGGGAGTAPHASPTLSEYECCSVRQPEEYIPHIGAARVEALKRLAGPVAGRRWVHINGTLQGGGVAELLQGMLPLARGLGLDTRWYALGAGEAFFQVTKKFHHLLQGLDTPLTLEELFGAYLDAIDAAAQVQIAADLAVVHDPQPAGIIMPGALLSPVLWRCHLDTSTPHPVVWRFLLPYINQGAGAIFTLPEFIGPGLQVPVYQILPGIDPLATKNRQYTEPAAREILAPLLHASGIDPDRPILASVSRYDRHKNQATVLEAFRRLRAERRFHPPPYLIFLGNTAADDPEGTAVLAQLQARAGEDPDVRFWVDVPNNDCVVGALLRLARGMVHVPTREGFGLVVTEALWQGTPVVGAAVGGVQQQILPGRTGYLVTPRDAGAIAAAMARLLDDPAGAAAMGRRGREHVRRHFLLPEVLRRDLILLRYYTGISRARPPFRVNGPAYREVLETLWRSPSRAARRR